MVNRKELSKIIIELRNKKGYSQRKLAMVSGVSNSTISRIENATSDADPETLKKIAPCLDISYEELMKAAGYMKEYNNITKETLSDESFKKILPAVIEALSEIIPDFDLTFEKLDDDSKVKLYNSVVKNTKHIDGSKNTEPVMIDLIDIDSTDNRNKIIKQTKEEPQLPDSFSTPEDAVKFLLEQNVIMGFGGFDIDKLSDEEKVNFANELLGQLKLLSYKYKK